MNKYPLYIISKGRPKCITSRELTKMRLKHFVVIEPQDEKDYKETLSEYATIIILPFSNLGQGSIPARNFVWEHSKKHGDKRHWIIDDNIFNMEVMYKGVRITTYSQKFFAYMESFVDQYLNIAVAGPHYHMFVIPAHGYKSPPLCWNSRVYSCLLIRNNLGFRWRGRYNEDTDLCLQALKKGYCVLLFRGFMINKATTLTMKGGNEQIYKETNDRYEFAEALRVQHPDCVKIVRKYNRWHHQVDYKRFKKNKPLKIKGAKLPKMPDWRLARKMD